MKRIVLFSTIIFTLSWLNIAVGQTGNNLDFKMGFNGEQSEDFIEDQSEDEFIVRGPSPWLNTGINVSEGCFVILISKGTVDVSSGWGVHDARGTDKFFENNNYPVNARYRYGLAAQITSNSNSWRGNRDAWIYEYEGTHQAKRSGRLWLVVNDDNPQDNSGEFHVRVRMKCD